MWDLRLPKSQPQTLDTSSLPKICKSVCKQNDEKTSKQSSYPVWFQERQMRLYKEIFQNLYKDSSISDDLWCKVWLLYYVYKDRFVHSKSVHYWELLSIDVLFIIYILDTELNSTVIFPISARSKQWNNRRILNLSSCSIVYLCNSLNLDVARMTLF